jgi:hypothetical protein
MLDIGMAQILLAAVHDLRAPNTHIANADEGETSVHFVGLGLN